MRFSLKAPAGPRIGANDRKQEKTEANVQNIEHRSSPRSPAPRINARTPRAHLVKQIVRDHKDKGRDAEANER